MPLKEVMTPGVEVIAPPEASISEAARRRCATWISALLVCDGERLVGRLTDRDITVRAVAAGRDPDDAGARGDDPRRGLWVRRPGSPGRRRADGAVSDAPVPRPEPAPTWSACARDLAMHAGTQPVMAEVLARVLEPGKAERK